MLGSGGMPSSHSATVMALAVAVGLEEGIGGSTFAVAVVLACVVCTCQPGFLHFLHSKLDVGIIRRSLPCRLF